MEHPPETQPTSDVDSILSDPNVEILAENGKTIYLVGTAHVSKKSKELVEKAIRELRPDSVAIELCESRYKALTAENRWKDMDLLSVIRQGKAYVLLVQLVLASYQKRLAAKLDIEPGAEMLKAIEVSKELGLPPVLADREVRTTLRRTWASLGFFSSLQMTSALIASIFHKQEVSEEDIERLKHSDALEEAMKEFSDAYPDIRRPLIDERDIYLAQKIRQAPGERIVAVVGAGHAPGIRKWIKEEVDLSELEHVPERFSVLKLIAWLIPSLIIGIFLYTVFAAGLDKGLELFGIWFWINAVMSALGAVLALAHPLTIVVSFFAAPFTSLNPMVGVGWLAALSEAWVRKPRVADFESLPEDIGSLRGIYRNRVSRIMLVLIFTSLLGSLATFIGGVEVLRRTPT